MSVRITLKGSKELENALKNMSDEIRVEVGEAVHGTAVDLEADVKLSIQQGQKTGRIYRRGGIVHQASAPGQAPASDTGALMGSVYSERIGDLSSAVGSRMAYAAYLEYGTSRMAARPFFRPAVERIRDDFNSRLETALRGATK